VSHDKCHNVTSHDGSHDKYGKIVHRPYSNCISSIVIFQKYDNYVILSPNNSPKINNSRVV